VPLVFSNLYRTSRRAILIWSNNSRRGQNPPRRTLTPRGAPLGAPITAIQRRTSNDWGRNGTPPPPSLKMPNSSVGINRAVTAVMSSTAGEKGHQPDVSLIFVLTLTPL